jgi:hypothetical protein
MPTTIDWANRALDKVGEKPITSVDDGTKAANLVKRMFAIVRDAELRKRRWSFSIKRKQLAADATAPLFGYGFQYQLPTDCLRVLTIASIDLGPDMSDYHGDGDSQLYRIEGRKILYGAAGTTGTALPLRYIASIEDSTQWDACFGEAFACKLAMELAEPLTGSDNKRTLAAAEYREALAEAQRANALELPSRAISDDTWVMSRVR